MSLDSPNPRGYNWIMLTFLFYKEHIPTDYTEPYLSKDHFQFPIFYRLAYYIVIPPKIAFPCRGIHYLKKKERRYIGLDSNEKRCENDSAWDLSMQYIRHAKYYHQNYTLVAFLENKVVVPTLSITNCRGQVIP